MELRAYQARSMPDALAKVKAEMGRDAVILHTRTIKRGGLLGIGARSMVEITATNDLRLIEARASASMPQGARPEPVFDPSSDAGECARALSPPTPAPVPRPDAAAPAPGAACDSVLHREVEEIRTMVQSLVRNVEQSRHPQLPAELIDHYTHLVGQDVAEEWAVQLLGRVSSRLQQATGPAAGSDEQGSPVGGRTVPPEWIRDELREALCEMVPPTEPLELMAKDRPTIVAMVGPTGVGKTTTIAKIAANMKLRQDKRVGLITIDTYRIAAVEQLKTYAQILDVPLVAVVTPEEMQAAVGQMTDVDLILIDTAGRSQKDEPRIAELGRFLAAARPDQVHLVLSTANREAAIREAIKNFSALGARHLIFTKVDEAVGFGVILNVLKSVDLRLSYLTNGQSVPNDIEQGTARRIAQLILETENKPAPSPSEQPASLPEGVTAGEGE